MHPRVLFAPVALLLTQAASAQTCEARVFAEDPNVNAFFGAALDYSGSEILSGAPGASDGSGTSVGAVHVFDRASPASAWSESAKIQPASLLASDRFGTAVARDGDTLAVGAPQLSGVTSTAPGRVFVFERLSASSWTETAELTPPDGAPQDRFGEALALEGDTLLVGAPGHDDAAAPGGSVYVYERNGAGAWSFVQRIDKPQSYTGTGFGSPLVLEGDLACVGAPLVSGGATSSGAVFAYTRSGSSPWSLLGDVLPSGLGIADLYGAGLALEGGTLAVGAPWHNGTVGNEGAVWIFEYDAASTTFSAPVEIGPTQVGITNDFGDALALDQDRLIVGAPAIDSAYVFERSGGAWSSPRWITPSLLSGSTAAGSVVELAGDTALLGDPSDSTFIFRDGAFYATDVTLGDADQNGLSDVCQGWWSVSCTQTVPNSSGDFATLEAAGSPFASDQSLSLTARGLPSFQFGLLVASQTPDLVITPGNSQGNLCLGGTIGRFNSLIAASNVGGTLALDVPIGAMPPPLPAAVSAGETWYFQLWHRDVNPTQTANFSETVEITYL